MKKEPTIAEYGCILVIVAILIIGLVLLNGLVAQVLFNWLLVDTFHLFNAHITYWVGLGIAIALGFVGSFFRGKK